MTYDPAVHHRRSIRLRSHNYAGGGVYFLTVCAWNRECLFGAIIEGEMTLNENGRVVQRVWRAITQRFPGIIVDAFQLMPNHFHGIVVIPGSGLEASLAAATGAPLVEPNVGAALAPPRGAASSAPTAPTLGRVVRAFKSTSAMAVNGLRGRSGSLRQRSYYEHVLRSAPDLEAVRDYIIHNPLRWVEDPENPAGRRSSAGPRPLHPD